jgi:hypothetical protein
MRAFFSFFGWNPKVFYRNIVGVPRFLSTAVSFWGQQRTSCYPKLRYSPCLQDFSAASISIKKHYSVLDYMISKRIYSAKPVEHLDVGSSFEFISHISIFTPRVIVGDIRSSSSFIENVNHVYLDLCEPQSATRQYESVSCLHVVEHIGLGRYNDRIDIDGDLKAIETLKRLVKAGGRLYIAVPAGKERVIFNKHRIYNATKVIGLLEDQFDVVWGIGITDRDEFVELHDIRINSQDYGLLMLELVKKPKSSTNE